MHESDSNNHWAWCNVGSTIDMPIKYYLRIGLSVACLFCYFANEMA